MSHQIPVSSGARADQNRIAPHHTTGLHDITADLFYQRLAIVNVAFVVLPGESQWVLIDTGIPGCAHTIMHAAESRFGKARPAAIVMTHGHFDHAGSLETLANEWDVPVYAHELELPYLTGQASYPPPDPTVGGGLMAAMAGIYPRSPVDVRRWLSVLPADGSVPPMPDWRWIHVPGHTPGQVAFWREADRVLIAADAFITTNQESAYAVAMQSTELHGPPMYYTQDWQASQQSVERLAALEPEIAITGHGRPLHGPELRRALHQLADTFEEVAIPKHGKYVIAPTHASDGSAYPTA